MQLAQRSTCTCRRSKTGVELLTEQVAARWFGIYGEEQLVAVSHLSDGPGWLPRLLESAGPGNRVELSRFGD